MHPTSMPQTKPEQGDDPSPPDTLRDEIRFLGTELGRVIRHHGGQELFDQVERVRRLSKRRRGGDQAADRELQELIARMTPAQTAGVIRSFACFFDLANIAEDRHRVRVLRDRERAAYPKPRPQSIAQAIEELHAQGVSAEAMRHLLERLDVELVFTAHPTEAKRRTVRQTLRRLRDDLTLLDAPEILTREREEVLRRVRADIACLWQTDPLRPQRPTVLAEVKRSLYLLKPLWDVIPRLYRDLRDTAERCYPGEALDAGRFLRFGTWIGGDRDGHPNVTAEVTDAALRELRRRTIAKHLTLCEHMSRVLTVSHWRQGATGPLADAIEQRRAAWPQLGEAIDALHPGEVYRHWLAVIHFRLNATLRDTPWADNTEDQTAAYPSAAALADDLTLLRDCLREAGHDELVEGELRDWLDRVLVFGFQFARLDIREHSGMLGAAVNELATTIGLTDRYEQMSEDEKVQFLTARPSDGKLPAIEAATLSEPTQRTLELFLLLDRVTQSQDSRALGVFIVSMTHAPSDVLTVLWLSRFAAGVHGHDDHTTLPIAPLFETIDDLQRADGMLDALLSNPVYREQVTKDAERQVCMIGYSDSAKDGGYLSANWALYDAQRRLAATARRHGVDAVMFHGRGGSLGRGGGPAARGILGLPTEAVAGKIRMTEQGEVMAERYDDAQIAHRHLEQVLSATLKVSAKPPVEPRPQWVALVSEAADISCEAYRSLIQDDGFVHYFEKASPIAGIETLTIGSRPARRSGRRTVADLRAIPFTFAWTQNRHLLNAYYGLGSALGPIADSDTALLHEVYEHWPWFRGVIDNASLALAKADMGIAVHYSELVDDDAHAAPLFQRVSGEFEKTRRVVLAITGEAELLANTPWLRASIDTRNPYVDPLNLVQVRMLDSLANRVAGAPGDIDEDLLRHSIQGIAAGLRTTG